jgi:diguanylate cyclase (GGDEF)-like protein
MRSALREGRSTAVAFIDLDGFKGVNDSYGHAVGDELIRQCAAIAKSLVPPSGMVARLGGDEFAILSSGAKADDELCNSVDALLEQLRRTFRIGERSISIGASVGLSSSTLGADNVSELMRQADIAMYAAKRSGKMRRLWFTAEMDRTQAVARTIEARLYDALDAEEFEVHYQPIIDARTGEVACIEGLLRWDQHGLAEIGPDRFIPVAEETGLIDRLGQFVLRRGCRDAADWGPVRLSVNVSSAQLRNPEFPAQLKQLLDSTGYPAERLELEVTETYVVVDPVMAGKVLSGIRELGVRLALDDFGTGYASIGFLRQFSFDTLKIDKTLIASAIHDQGARAMLHASIAVARALNMATVAEGIENEAQAHFMRTAGCDYLQGWLYSRAVDAATIGEYLATPRELMAAGEADKRLSA